MAPKVVKKPERKSNLVDQPIHNNPPVADIPKPTEPVKPEEITDVHIPVVYDISDVTDNIFDTKPDVKLSQNIDYPSFSLGFQHFLHADKGRMEITKNFEGKKKVYLVMNKFEPNIDNYESDIHTVSPSYFGLNSKPPILNLGFYKLWEILMMFDLISVTKSNFISAHLAGDPGSFIQATMYFRDKFSKSSKNDTYNAIGLLENDQKHVPKLNKEFVDYCKKEKPVRLVNIESHSKQSARLSKNKHDGDLSNPKMIKLIGGKLAEKVDFITADGGSNWTTEYIQEQQACTLILSQILTALKIQAHRGNFVCKIYESFTKTTVKMIYILRTFYEKVYMVKPLVSRNSSSEKYLVCLDYKFKDQDKNKNILINHLENIIEIIFQNPTFNVANIFSDFQIPDDFLTKVIHANINIANKQFVSMNEIIDFIEKDNYYGDEYKKKRDIQITANKYWIDRYYLNDISKTKDKIESQTKATAEYFDKLAIELKNKLG